MKVITVVMLFMLTPDFAAVSQQTNGWRGIIPLRSTRTDVERQIGKPNFKGELYDFEKERVDITYSTAPCTRGMKGSWNVPPDTVISIRVAPKTDIQFSDLQLDESKYKKTNGGHLPYVFYYTNDEGGVQVEVIKGAVASITYFPSAENKHLRCPATASPRHTEGRSRIPHQRHR